MEIRKKAVTLALIGAFLAAGITAWGASGKQGGKPPEDPTDPPVTPIVGYYFWRLGHMDGPHDESKALGISRDGKVAVGATKVVDFIKAFRLDIDWAISTGDGVAPLYNELQVQENMGNGISYAASDMLDETGVPVTDCAYSKVDPEDESSAENLDWCGSLPVGTLTTGTVSYAAEWLWAFDPEALEPNYVAIPDFGGGISDMKANGVSADGMIFVGTGNTKTGQQAFLADMATATTDETTDETIVVPVQLTIAEILSDGTVGQTLQTSSAQAVSADGTIIAGYGGVKTGNKAFVTIYGGTVTDEAGNVSAILTSTILPTIPGGKFAEAYALTTVTDETTGEITAIYVAGRSDSAQGPQACIWFQGDDPATEETETETWVVKGIGGLSTKKYNSVATGIVHRPGSTAGELMVVGTTQTILYPSEAFVWTGNPVLVADGPYTLPDGTESDWIGYMYDLEKILTKTGAAESSGMGSEWILNQGTGVALSYVTNAGDNGPSARIVGWGTNPEGGIEAWLVTNYPYDDLVFIKE
jgi:uncharacterized membrane protein